jgi:hypothetical protein
MVLSSFCSGLIIWILRLGGRLLFEGELELKMLLGLGFARAFGKGLAGNAGWL